MNVFLRKRLWYADFRVNGKRHRKTLHRRDSEMARDAAMALASTIAARATLDQIAAEERELWAYIVRGREAAISRDRKRKRAPDLSPDDLRKLWKRCAGTCEVTGLPFSMNKAPGTFRRPFAPSLDRIDNSKAYSLANTRIICVAANIAINQWGDDVFRRIAFGFVTTRAWKHVDLDAEFGHTGVVDAQVVDLIARPGSSVDRAAPS